MPFPESGPFGDVPDEDPYADPVGAEPQAPQPGPPPPDSGAVATDLFTQRTEGYAPFDPTEVTLTQSTAPALKDDDGNDLPAFDERVSQDFDGLMFLGSLSKSFYWAGHHFQIRTLTMAEEMAIPILTREFQDTTYAGVVYEAAVASLCVHKIDGRSLPVPFEKGDEYEWARQRFMYAKGRWFRPTFARIYVEYLELEQRTEAVVRAMGKASAPQGSPTG